MQMMDDTKEKKINENEQNKRVDNGESTFYLIFFFIHSNLRYPFNNYSGIMYKTELDTL